MTSKVGVTSRKEIDEFGSEDSSYDSEREEDNIDAKHLERKFSPSIVISECPQTSSDEHENDQDQIEDSDYYSSMVEFSLRLGYTEKLLKRALKNIGPCADQNKVLEELIRLQQLSETAVHRRWSQPSDSCLGNKVETVQSLLPLLPIVIDGSNVAMSHGSKDTFSCRGLRICVQWFQDRGHNDITVFVPKWRKESSNQDNIITDQHILDELERERLLFFTPSRQVLGRRFVCHDDRYILNLAAETEAIVVSNDNYRELIMDKPQFRKVIEEKILMYSFVNDRFMPPDDPLGRSGPTLEVFLRYRPNVSVQDSRNYGRKFSVGQKNKFLYPDRHPGGDSNNVAFRKQSLSSTPESGVQHSGESVVYPQKRSLCRTNHLNHDVKSFSFENISPLTLPPPSLLSGTPLPDFSYPPPQSSERGRHLTLSRIASAPEKRYDAHFPHKQLHKSQSTGVRVENSTAVQLEQERLRLRFHLLALFKSTTVDRALNELPGECDPHIICAYILFLNSKH